MSATSLPLAISTPTDRRRARPTGSVVFAALAWTAFALFAFLAAWDAGGDTEASMARRLAYAAPPFAWFAVAIFASRAAVLGERACALPNTYRAVTAFRFARSSRYGGFGGPARSAASFALSGLVVGGAALSPRAGWVAWFGVAALAFGIRQAGTRAAAAFGVLMAGLTSVAIDTHWIYQTLGIYGPPTSESSTLGWRAGAFTCVVALLTLTRHAPTLIAIYILPRRLPTAAWLPLTWALGELLSACPPYECALTSLLGSQWQFEPVLRILGAFGWYPTLFIGLVAACAIGDALTSRDVRSAWPALAALVLAFAVPNLAHREGELDGIGVVHMADIDHPPRTSGTIDLLVWPEASLRGRQRGTEGDAVGSEARVEGLIGEPRDGHIANRILQTPRGLLNAAVAVHTDGTLRRARGKSALVPVGERSLGPTAAAHDGFRRGSEGPVLAIGAHRVVAAICYEAFDRALFRRGSDEGANLFVVMSNDRPLAGSAVARDQSLGALILRAVEFHTPAARASLHGSAVLIGSDGAIVAIAEPETTGVLTNGETRGAL